MNSFTDTDQEIRNELIVDLEKEIKDCSHIKESLIRYLIYPEMKRFSAGELKQRRREKRKLRKL